MTMDDQGAPNYRFTPPPPPFTPGPPAGGDQPGGHVRRKWGRAAKLTAGIVLVLGAGGGAAAVAVVTSAGGAGGLTPAATAVKAASSSESTTSTSTTVPSAAPWGRLPGGMSSGKGRAGFNFTGRGRVPGLGALGALGGASALGAGALGPGGGGLGLGNAAVGGAGMVHASYTVKLPSGSYQTVDVQLGTAQDVSSTSITVKSADGFTQQYQVATSTIVNADYEGILSVKQGDSVAVSGIVSDSSGSTVVDAKQVTDLTQVQAGRASRGWGNRSSTTVPPTTQPTANNSAA